MNREEMLKVTLLLVFTFLSVSSLHPTPIHSSDAPTYRPIVLWHGMGDTCCNPQSMGFLMNLTQKYLPGVYIHSIEIGNTESSDQWNSFFMNVNDQVDLVCRMLANDSKLAKGFNAVGFSQGSQFLRAYVERCNSPPVYNLVSIGGQHQGVYGMPKCPAVNSTLCEYMRYLLDVGAYVSWVQEFVVQAEYWQDPFNEEEYVKKCVFLPDVNNQGSSRNETYKKNLESLNKFAMVKFTHDTMVQPIASEWFGFYKPGQDKDTLSLQETDLYKQDWIGMKTLDQAGKLDFLAVDGDHLQFNMTWYIDTIVGNYLNNTL